MRAAHTSPGAVSPSARAGLSIPGGLRRCSSPDTGQSAGEQRRRGLRKRGRKAGRQGIRGTREGSCSTAPGALLRCRVSPRERGAASRTL